MQNRIGSIINCWARWLDPMPKERRRLAFDAVNHIAHTLPTNPNGDDNGNGYTNLQEWLQRKAAGLE